MAPDARERSRKKVIGYSTLAIAVIIVAVLGLTSIYGSSSSGSTGVARTVTVTRGTVQSSVSASGNTSAVSTANENFSTSGTLTAVNVSVGDEVTAGEVLATIDSAQARTNLQSAEANLASAQTTLAHDQAGGSPAQQAQNQASLVSAQQQLVSAQNQLAADQTSLQNAQSTLASDQALGCPPSSSTGASGNSSTSTSGALAGATRLSENLAPTAGPSVTTGTAGSPGTTTVTLSGTVNPNGGATTYYFRYGTTTSLSSSTSSASAGSGSTPTQVSAVVTGLTPNTSYLFQLVATNSAGTSSGLSMSFTTAQSSCVTDQNSITSYEQAVAKDQSTVAAAQLSVQSAQANLEITPATIAQDEATVSQDQVTVTADQKALVGTTLVALISGTVTSVSNSVGDTVSGSGSSTNASTGSSSSSSSNSPSGSSSGGSTGGTASNGGSTGGTASSGGSSSSTSSSGSGSSSSSSSSSFITIQGLNNLEVVANFAESDASKIAVGQPATVTLSALPDTEVSGVVTAVSPTSSVVSNVVTYPVTVVLANPASTVKQGMTAQVAVIVQTATDVLELPSAAITTTGSISTVKVIDANGTQVTTRVTLGLVGTTYTEITSGLTEGQKVAEPTASVSASSGTSSIGGGGGGFPGGGGGFGGGAP
jgi:multidrug efflux pump subunit AcrA (membrane-fusion protein)